jgi:hypothetical protein
MHDVRFALTYVRRNLGFVSLSVRSLGSARGSR